MRTNPYRDPFTGVIHLNHPDIVAERVEAAVIFQGYPEDATSRYYETTIEVKQPKGDSTYQEWLGFGNSDLSSTLYKKDGPFKEAGYVGSKFADRPIFYHEAFPHPLALPGERHIVLVSSVLNEDFKTPHITNERHFVVDACKGIHPDNLPCFGGEVEVTLFTRDGMPLGLTMDDLLNPPPQGEFYKTAGANVSHLPNAVLVELKRALRNALPVKTVHREVAIKGCQIEGSWGYSSYSAEVQNHIQHLWKPIGFADSCMFIRWGFGTFFESVKGDGFDGLHASFLPKPLVSHLPDILDVNARKRELIRNNMMKVNGSGHHLHFSVPAMMEEGGYQWFLTHALPLFHERYDEIVECSGIGNVEYRLAATGCEAPPTTKPDKVEDMITVAGRIAPHRAPLKTGHQGKGPVELRTPAPNFRYYRMVGLITEILVEAQRRSGKLIN